MVFIKQCDCAKRVGITINSYQLFEELQTFFEEQVKKGIFQEAEVEEPYALTSNGIEEMKWYATKWYRCNCCGCLWEFNYPDFPSLGFVRKFANGKYEMKEDYRK